MESNLHNDAARRMVAEVIDYRQKQRIPFLTLRATGPCGKLKEYRRDGQLHPYYILLSLVDEEQEQETLGRR